MLDLLLTLKTWRRVARSYLCSEKIRRNYFQRKKTAWRVQSELAARAVASLSDGDVLQRIDELLTRIDALPGLVKKQLLRAKEMRSDIASHRNFLNVLLTKESMFAAGRYPTTATYDSDARSIEGKISTLLQEADCAVLSQVSQYDLLAGSKLFFPETARTISQERLRTDWNYILRKSVNVSE